ncbi:MAG: hypothetical protein K9W46_05825 [Candidatus Heimdallarchaeum endolithica]|uniref:Helix-hairpin-helix DNA-binding motif class 1 domain-containing protein n=1 Tax=Candidatus Heimdallarchaeum endolithica TaxID=2876572 RepID=A0A9Y1FQ46_9ARCH|nr:MAG: hypothetical protein K9W46_05825 [Candidatus Heimdallarchaeum endolithica]
MEPKITDIPGIGAKKADDLKKRGFDTVEKIANASLEELTDIPGVGKVTADKMRRAAKELLESASEKTAPVKEPKKKVEPKAEPKKKAEPKAKKEKITPVKKTQPVTLKVKTKTKKPKTGKPKKEKIISQTYGVVQSLVHDKVGRSSNNSIIVRLLNTEMPLASYIGRKAIVTNPENNLKMVGKITHIHGKRKSRDKNVIVRFNKSVSPHIIQTKVIVK